MSVSSIKLTLERAMDFWIGVPLCGILDLWEGTCRLFGVLRAGPSSGSPRKILLIKLSELGAIVLSYPLLMKLRKKYPDAEIWYLTFNKNKDLFRVMGGVVPPERVLTVREHPLWIVGDALQALKRLRQEEMDLVFDLEFFSRVSALLTYLTGAPKRVGFYRYDMEGLYRGSRLLTHRVIYNPLSHVTRSYLSMAIDLDSGRKESPEFSGPVLPEEVVLPKYVSDPAARSGLLKQLTRRGCDPSKEQIYLMNPGEGLLPLREWPVENFVEVAGRLLEKEENRVIFVGTSGAEKKTAFILRRLNHSRAFSLVGETSLTELLELYGVSRALISNDCGLVHLAMLTPIQKFVFFGPESPQIFGPRDDRSRIFYSNWLCSPCLSAFNHRQSSCRDNQCLKQIHRGDVMDALLRT